MSIFNKVRINKPKRNAFNLSHDVKLTMNMGDLVPVLCQEVVPGDTFVLNSELFVRMAPMIAPIMHHVNIYTHYFFVPNRLVWKEWETFITGGKDGTESPVMPYFNTNSISKSSLFDYLGYPVGDIPNDARLSSLPLRGYQLIYNDYYRDQNLHDELEISRESGLDTTDEDVLFPIRKRCWEKDYFTSALPWTQKGPEVSIPLSGDAQVKLDESSLTDAGRNPKWRDRNYSQSLQDDVAPLYVGDYGSANRGQHDVPADVSQPQVAYDPNGSLYADLKDVSGTTINELRRSIRLQEWLERNARAGSRYIEQIFSHFGVKSSDARLQRPEFLGGGKSNMQISEVLQTSSSDDTTPQANMAGHGMSLGKTHGMKATFEEHGYVFAIVSVMPRTSYSQGCPRAYLKRDKFDYYWPSFAHLGEQEIYRGELYYTANESYNKETFGYQSRYSEYKYCPSRVCGDFRDNMSYWHMGRLFNIPPTLSAEFVEANPTHRIYAVTDNDAQKLYVQCYHNFKAVRPMPRFGTPML